MQSAYGKGLTAALRHKAMTLSVMLLTIGVTIVLFIIIPKGFFPQQDTGMIVGITEAAQDVSPADMRKLQLAVIDSISKDPAVANATGYIGPGGPTVTDNNGRLFIQLKPHNQRDLSADQVIRRLDAKLHINGCGSGRTECVGVKTLQSAADIAGAFRRRHGPGKHRAPALLRD
jgi:multidrug efflux pump